MFESLKKRMILDESKKISENALEIILEEMDTEDEIEEAMVLESMLSDDDEIEKLIDEIPDDEDLGSSDEEDIPESFLDEEMKYLESFIGEETSIDSQSSEGYIQNEDLSIL